jgi:saccharopine dehydrogenase-like NADP-dependent oxidoreductase
MVSLMNQGFDVVLDFLPPHFVKSVTKAAIRARVKIFLCISNQKQSRKDRKILLLLIT